MPVVALVLLGLAATLLGYLWAWPLAVGTALALVVWLLAKKTDMPTRKFFGGLALTVFVLAVVLGALGIIAVMV